MADEGKGSARPINFEFQIRRRFPRALTACLVLALVVSLLYFNSLGNQFTNWDDSMIYENPQIRSLSWENISKIFKFDKGGTYQPVRVLSYAVDYQFWKLNPTGYHITNTLLYMLTCVIIFFTISHLSASLRDQAPPESHERVGLFGSLLFAVHPVHVEAVTWLAARKEVLQGFFFFLAFHLYLKGRKEEGGKRFLYLGLTLFVFLLATLSKPSAIVFPAVILVYEISVSRKRWLDFIKRHWVFIGVCIGLSIFFSLVVLKVMFEAGGIKPYRGGTFFNNLVISFYAFLYNIKLLLFTINYSAAYTIPVTNPILSLRTFVFIGITLIIFGLSLWSLRRMKVIFFCFFFFLITIFPYLNLIPISTLLADRYVFIASFSYCFLLGIGFDRFYGLRSKRFSENFFKLLSVALFLFMLAGYSFMTIRQNRIWENSYTLWADAVAKAPESNSANALMGVVCMELGMDNEAAKYLEKAVQILPYDYLSRNNLGIVYGRLGERDKAIKEFMTAIWLKPEDNTIKVNLSAFYQSQKEYQKAEEVLKDLLSRDAKNAYLHYRLGLLYKEMGQYDSALLELTKSMELAPHIINPYEELGNIYASRLRDAEKARSYYTKGIEAVPEARSRVEQLRWMVQDLEAYR
ncbi:MAG: tetratricopeptide repeat protein [Syntrophaceae bacterium]|nr:tetratricopeptide repeat protein [Syntrophaceae bacterium]